MTSIPRANPYQSSHNEEKGRKSPRKERRSVCRKEALKRDPVARYTLPGIITAKDRFAQGRGVWTLAVDDSMPDTRWRLRA